MSKIQVIIPVYNAEETIHRCLSSLIGQTFSDWQALIIDDSSSDKSKDIINEFADNDNRFVYIKTQKNHGAAGARNEGLLRLCAPYTTFLDSDDVWESDYLEKMLGYSEKYDADIVQCRYLHDFPNGSVYVPKGVFRKDTVLSGKSLGKIYKKAATGINMNHVCMKLIKTELLSGALFDEDLRTAEDLDFCIRLYEKTNTYVFIDSVLYRYNRTGNSLTGSSLSFREKLSANRTVSHRMAKSIRRMSGKIGPVAYFYSLLAYIRPYIIIVSKIFRSTRERIIKK